MEYKELPVWKDVVQSIMTSRDEELAVLTVSELAERFEVDRFKLTRKFKTSRNTTLESYINREKMFRSAFLLLSDDDITVQEIAERMGFCTSYYFSQVFEKFFGIVPVKYREYKQLSSWIKDRRTGPRNRRKKPKKRSSDIPERRKVTAGRRTGVKDRRKDFEEDANRVSIQDLLRMMS